MRTAGPRHREFVLAHDFRLRRYPPEIRGPADGPNFQRRDLEGLLPFYHLPLDICGVCSPIFPEYRMNLNGSVFWFFSISLR